MKGLEELGIEPTHVAGTSAGAVVAALYAAGLPADGIRDALAQTKRFTRQNLAFRWSGLLNPAKIIAPLAPYFPEDDFAKLSWRLYVTRTDLETGLGETVSTGSVLDATHAAEIFAIGYHAVMAARHHLGGVVET